MIHVQSVALLTVRTAGLAKPVDVRAPSLEEGTTSRSERIDMGTARPSKSSCGPHRSVRRSLDGAHWFATLQRGIVVSGSSDNFRGVFADGLRPRLCAKIRL
jgi:hypothetical protein